MSNKFAIEPTGGAGSVTSTEVSIVNSRVNSVNAFLSGISARSVGGVSTHGIQSVIDALSNRLSAGGGTGSVTSTELSAVSAQAASAIDVVSNALSNEISNRASAVSVVSHGLSVLSQQNSVEHAALSARANSAETHASTASAAATSVDGRVNSVNTFLSGISSRSVGDISTHGIQSVINALSNRISAGGGTGSVTSNELSAVEAALSGKISVVSNAASIISHAVSVLSQQNSVEHAALSVRVNSADTHASTASAAATSADAHANTASAAATSVDGRVNSVNTFLSGISALSVGGVSTHGIQSVINALSNRISAGAGGSVTSTELSAVSAQAASAINVVSNALSNEISVRASAISTVSHAVSVLSQQNSVEHADLSNKISVASAAATSADGHANTASAAATSVDSRVNSVNTFLSGISAISVGGVSTHGIQSVVNALSNRISAAIAGVASVTSTELSATEAALSTRINSVNSFLSGISARSAGDVSTHGVQSVVNALSARIGEASVNVAHVISGGAQLISSTTLVNISGLSVSVSAGGLYRISAYVMFNRADASTPTKLGMTFPAMSRTRGVINCFRSANPAFSQPALPLAGIWDGDSASGSIIISQALSSIQFLSAFATWEGLMQVSTASGVVQLQAAASGAQTINIMPGSFVKVWKVK